MEIRTKNSNFVFRYAKTDKYHFRQGTKVKKKTQLVANAPQKTVTTLIYVKLAPKNLKKNFIYEHLVKKSCTFAPQEKPILIINDTNSVLIFFALYYNVSMG